MHTQSISLPPHLRPSDGRFGSGPSLVRPAALGGLSAAGSAYLGTSHRHENVRSVVRRIRHGLALLFALPDGYEVALGNGGATLFWDAAIFSLIEEQSLHYVCGAFSQRFADAVASAPHLRTPYLESAPPGSRPELVASGDADTIALIHNETSTGVWMPVEPADGGGLVVVDATSAAGAMEVDPAAFDAYYFSPQKAFGSEGGLWVALLSPAAVERIGDLASLRWTPPSLDLAAALAESRNDQTLNTPALATLFLLADQIEWLLEQGGLEWAAARCRTSSSILYDWAEQSPHARPFVADPGHRSPTVVTLEMIGVEAKSVSDALRANGIVDTGGYRQMGGNTTRFAVFPNVDPGDVERLTGALDFIIERL
ncbi:MAG: phosphoserine transaminase [Acidimicrobiia bacterium]|nr:phosphoserine transaminase [Acidimicrobiia bacterium]